MICLPIVTCINVKLIHKIYNETIIFCIKNYLRTNTYNVTVCLF